MTLVCSFLVLLFVVCGSQFQASAEAANPDLDLGSAVLVVPADLPSPQQKAIQMLLDEVEKRTTVRWPVARAWPDGPHPVIAVGPASLLSTFAGPYAARLAGEAEIAHAEGYRIRALSEKNSQPAVFVIGSDARGVLFGVGRLLRELRMTRGAVGIGRDTAIHTAPKYPLRGHQLGYRPKVNTYDAWTVPMWEQYIRDLAVFGTNAIELIPPRSDDDDDSPHFPLPKIEMMNRVSQLANEYGLDVWIWYPAMDRDYAKPETVAFALDEWEAVFERLPRIDAVFVPGGDPGHTQPKHLMALLEKQAERLHRHHPDAQMWVSPQSFNREWLDEFLEILRTQSPPWFDGVVFGPQVRVSLPELRAAVPAQYPIRRYPDITHSIHCQYPVPDWDLAYVLTEHRETINPRPLGEANIFRVYQDHAIGFLTYSEGVNDDVNKIVWSALGWDPDADVGDVLRQYARYFIGEEYTDAFAQGLLALERNWQGPLLNNQSVFTTLAQFKDMERSASPQVLLNWRFQQGLYRAYYDAYQARRLAYETELEEQAMDVLRRAPELGATLALDRAESILDRALTDRVAPDLRARVFELAEALYQSIRMQLSVPRYKAISVDRGANLDLVDNPLNNHNWLKDRFATLREVTRERDRLAGIEAIVNWTNPGPGGFYDDLGNVRLQPHLLRGLGPKSDPDFRQTALLSFEDDARDRRMSWMRHAEALYDAALRMQYDNLDPGASYQVRIAYAGEGRRPKIRLLANDETEIHPFIKVDPADVMAFDIPRNATANGALTLTWYQEPGRGGNGRGCQVAEVWLVRRDNAGS